MCPIENVKNGIDKKSDRNRQLIEELSRRIIISSLQRVPGLPGLAISSFEKAKST